MKRMQLITPVRGGYQSRYMITKVDKMSFSK